MRDIGWWVSLLVAYILTEWIGPYVRNRFIDPLFSRWSSKWRTWQLARSRAIRLDIERVASDHTTLILLAIDVAMRAVLVTMTVMVSIGLLITAALISRDSHDMPFDLRLLLYGTIILLILMDFGIVAKRRNDPLILFEAQKLHRHGLTTTPSPESPPASGSDTPDGSA